MSENFNVLLFYNFSKKCCYWFLSTKINEDLIRIKETKSFTKNVFNSWSRHWTFKTMTVDGVDLKWT